MPALPLPLPLPNPTEPPPITAVFYRRGKGGSALETTRREDVLSTIRYFPPTVFVDATGAPLTTFTVLEPLPRVPRAGDKFCLLANRPPLSLFMVFIASQNAGEGPDAKSNAKPNVPVNHETNHENATRTRRCKKRKAVGPNQQARWIVGPARTVPYP